MTKPEEEELFIDCEGCGLNEDGLFIPYSQIPKIKKAITIWEENK